MKRTAFGLILPAGAEPALSASTASPPWICAKASAIWLRLAFSTQTNRMRFTGMGSWHRDSGTAPGASPRDGPATAQQQPELGAQQVAPLSTFGFAGRACGEQVAPSVAQAASAA